jgi:hypothetical protein
MSSSTNSNVDFFAEPLPGFGAREPGSGGDFPGKVSSELN